LGCGGVLLASRALILLIRVIILASATMEFSIEWMPPFYVEVVDDLALNPSHCMVFSAISSKNLHALSYVILMKSP